MVKEYIIKEDYAVAKKVSSGWGSLYITQEIATVKSGTFLKPIWNKLFVPKHVIERFSGISTKGCVYCYCSQGILPIPEELIYEIY